MRAGERERVSVREGERVGERERERESGRGREREREREREISAGSSWERENCWLQGDAGETSEAVTRRM